MKLFVVLIGSVPLSVTRTVTRLDVLPCAHRGVQRNTPVAASIAAASSTSLGIDAIPADKKIAALAAEPEGKGYDFVREELYAGKA